MWAVSSWATNVNSMFLTDAASSNTHSQVFAYLRLSKHETGTVKIWFRRLRMCTCTGACAVSRPGRCSGWEGEQAKNLGQVCVHQGPCNCMFTLY